MSNRALKYTSIVWLKLGVPFTSISLTLILSTSSQPWAFSILKSVWHFKKNESLLDYSAYIFAMLKNPPWKYTLNWTPPVLPLCPPHLFGRALGIYNHMPFLSCARPTFSYLLSFAWKTSTVFLNTLSLAFIASHD